MAEKNKICDLFVKEGRLLMKKKIELIHNGCTEEEACNCLYAFCPNVVAMHYAKIVGVPDGHVYTCPKDIYNGCKDNEAKNNKYYDWLVEKVKELNMKFDYVIQNPPYDGTLHIKFTNLGLDIIDKGEIAIIQPASWVVDIKRGSKRLNSERLFNPLKERVKGHVKSIKIENLNKEFGTSLYFPFAVTTIDMSKTFDYIDCDICGEHKTIDSIYDCNLIGKYTTIWSILNKIKSFNDMMSNHTTKEKLNGDYWYTKYSEIISLGGCAATTGSVGCKYESENVWINTKNGNYCTSFITTTYHTYKNEISSEPLLSYDRGHKLTNNIADNIYGSKKELENWKHFIFNNKLPLFVNIVMTIDQHNNSKEFIPWLVDKQYTDEEINEMFGLTDEEIKLIDLTIKKFERNSPWFKRYMCGPSCRIKDKEVNNFIEEISK